MSVTFSSSAGQATGHIPAAFSVANNAFLDIIGSAPKLELLVENNDLPFAHEASVYIPPSHSLFMCSNIFTDPITNQSTTKVSRVNPSAYPFNSLNDVVVHSDGPFWFMDPIYAWRQGIRPKPKLPNQVYRYHTHVMADGLGRLNGITFAPDEKTVYITDTAQTDGDESKNLLKAATMKVEKIRQESIAELIILTVTRSM
ncbi:hypothetical protein N7512_000360 [Penicillium capsulatum]|nr:hypothetical protein N7512_000360 [Penicillium capsulatum]